MRNCFRNFGKHISSPFASKNVGISENTGKICLSDIGNI
jgi:hypothetical protein